MIPASVYDLPSMADVLISRGIALEKLYQCPCCSRALEPKGFCDVSSLPNPVGHPRFICHTCASHTHRVVLAQQEAEQEAALPPWETEAATTFRVERDRRINATLWTTAEGSPLTTSCREEWCAWRIEMHRLTQKFDSPAEVVWPIEPVCIYTPAPLNWTGLPTATPEVAP